MKKRILKLCMAALLGTMLCGCTQTDKNNESNLQPVVEENIKADEKETAFERVEEVAKDEVFEELAEKTEAEQTPEPEEPNYDIIPENYAYSLTVSINPLVELFFDSDNMVVGIFYLNKDAVDAYKDVELVGTKLDEGMDMLVTAATEKGYIKEEATIEIELAKVSEDIEEPFDTAILIEASQVVNEVLKTICDEQEITIEASVEVSVNEEVQETTGVSAPVVCSDCNGTGNNCKECNGTAIVNCKRCVNGVESCGTCHGTAIINCHGCKGAGGDCNHCDGSGKISCDACGGKGTFLCSWCKGELRHICPMCWGEGTCPTCGGDGII